MKKRQTMLLLVTLMMALVIVVPASAQTTEPPYRLFLPAVYKSEQVFTLTASADAFVFENGPGVNTGKESALFVGNDQDPESRLGVMRAFVRFDLPAVEPSAVKKAILRIYYAGYADFPNTGRSVQVCRVGQPWGEDTVTWATQPYYGDPTAPIGVYSNEPFGYRDVDVTGQAQRMLENLSANYGFAILGEEWNDERWSYRVFAARESAYPPQLVLTLN